MAALHVTVWGIKFMTDDGSILENVLWRLQT